jgi:adenylate kinase family enzyme
MKVPLRINVIGTSGSGKSTFGKTLAQKLGCPYVEMDQLFWGRDWHWPSDEVFFERLRNAISSDKWVLDGNYTRTLPIKWEKVEMVIWLDYSFSLTLWQAVQRAFKRAWSGKEIWEGTGNRESFRKSFFSNDSIILWTIRTHKSVRTKYESYLNDPKYSHIEFVRIKNRKDASIFLDKVRLNDD